MKFPFKLCIISFLHVSIAPRVTFQSPPASPFPLHHDTASSSSNASSVNSLLNGGSGCPIEMDKIVIPLDENERILSLQMALKCSDLGHVGWVVTCQHVGGQR